VEQVTRVKPPTISTGDGGKFNDLRSALGPRGKWVVGFSHANLQIFVAWPGYGISGKAQLLAGGWGLGPGDAKGAMGSYRERPRRSEMSV
jgi:hypothetical protein